MKHKTKLLIIGFLILISCSEKSEFLEDCECEKIDLKNGIVVNGKENRYSVVLPDSSWNPEITDIGLSAGTFDDSSFKYFGINEMGKAKPWMSLDEQQKDVERKYDVIESGVSDMLQKKSIWNLVEEKFNTIPIIGLYVTVEHPTDDLFYTVNLAVSKNKYGKKELCELENIIKSFKMN
ncbi:hypothetical protein ESY86_20020 [Subsaximicrobium wynnwilliamsii]|uniref:DUF3805 domain-containing protein n=1 Tax=Subsaximicrobium wynnwilliamsii TaxID=291179 RepID=A0A5C6ZAY3_9FLAO|nr:hypothetical protein [Subsaximicrobium wynnwilliamsii]TXD80860.1 hypothetical protein ESY87_20010 [Subsaximicrobium wynnwilliamsii]TXD86519.1 hypothetical protein ESY86_20020 [Subsaximicrobium wynnwilliamsii]TXE00146.1 hypothetical protein ESY88_19970 [Subsaximicrobium wynnwilliamsii]